MDGGRLNSPVLLPDTSLPFSEMPRADQMLRDMLLASYTMPELGPPHKIVNRAMARDKKGNSRLVFFIVQYQPLALAISTR